MSKEKIKIKRTAESTGEEIGTDIKKGAKAVNDFGKGIKKGLKKEE